MANETHTITITAKDGTSQTFKAIGAAATKSGQEMERAAQRGADAQKKLQDRLTATGAAVGGLVGITSKLGQAHLSESRQIGALERAYGNQAESINKLADEMQGLGIASDDAVRISALGAQSLARNYGFTADQITQLITVSADLSAVTFDQYGNQLQLADVTQRVAGAMRGEGEAAEILGLNMSDSAVAAEAAARGMTTYGTSMTEAEKAQFRFTLLLEQTASSQGAAGQQADTLAGKVNAMKLGVIDAGSAFGGMLGPAGEAAAVLGDVALAAPLVGAGLGRAAAGMATATKATLAFNAAGKAGLLGTLIAIAPAAIVAAAAIGGVAIAVHEAEQGTKGLVEDINALGAAFEDLPNPELDKQWNTLVAQIANPAQVDVVVYGNKRIQASMAAYEPVLSALRRDVPLTTQFLADMAAAGVDVSDGLMPDELRIVIPMLELYRAVMAEAGVASGELAASQMAMATALAGSGDGADRATEATGRLSKAEQAEITTSQASTAAATAKAIAYLHATKVSGEHGDALDRVTGAEGDFTDAVQGGINARQIAIATTERLTATREAAAAAAEAEAQAVLAATQSYAEMVGTTNALDSGISVVIGGLDRLGGGVEKVKTSLEGLVGESGVWGELDNMSPDAEGLITWDQYNAAVAASYSVTQDAASSQDWMNTILANQAPLLAGLVSDQENYLESLSRLPADQQLLALAYMDSAEAGKALELQTLALSAVNGELGESGKQLAKDMIRGAAEASPVTRALLEDMGAISVGAEGTIKINWPEEGQSPIDRLTAQMATIAAGLEVSLNVDLNDDGIIGYVPPEKEMKVKPVVDEAEAPTFDPIEWPVNLKVEGGGTDRDAVLEMLGWGGGGDAVTVPVEYSYETFEPPELTNYTATIDVEAATANEKIGELEQLLGTIDTATASASVSLDTGLFDTGYSTVTANVETLDALTASVSVSIVSAVGGKVQDIVNDAATLDALTASVEIDGDSAKWFDVSNAVAESVGSVDAWSATVSIDGDGQPFWDVMNNVSVSKDQVDGWNPIVSIGGDGQPFWDAMNNVSVSKDQVDGWNPIVSIGGESGGWFGEVGGVMNSVSAVEGWSATIDILANTSGYYANLPTTGASLGTNYIDVVSRQIGRPFLHGGMVEPAAHGRMPGSAMTLVGETGPELVSLPYGSSVTPASATKARLGNRGGGGGDVYIETLVVQSNDARQLVDTMRGYAIMGARP